MRKKIAWIIVLFAGWCPTSVFGQQKPDSIPLSVTIDEVIISAKKEANIHRLAKPTSSIEEYLQGSEKIGMIKRGNYAWEPTVNNMATERISVTIDGMKIFHACTDKMDPVTSYVETNNLKKVSLTGGLGAAPNATNNIGGSLDLILNKSGFCGDGLNASANFGYETNSNLWTGASSLSYANPNFYINAGFSHRKSENYKAGGGQEIQYSQFTKNNFFTNLGYVVSNGKAIEGTLIYDRATNVGYPALTMDVSKAEGFISSVSYTVENPLRYFYKWENKAYYNSVVHIMDDTKRPAEEVAMHMDMPGETHTGGFYSTLSGNTGRHRYTFNWDAYYNKSYAEMTMYPKDANEETMFMLTWPDVRTLNTGLFIVDQYNIGKNHSLRFSAKGTFQRDGLYSHGKHGDFGLEQNRGYYPNMSAFKNRILGNVSALYQFKKNGWEGNANVGYGNRAPSVSEAYGFFLFNTFDTYDYLGNPYLKAESALETSLSVKWKRKTLEAKLEVSNFYFTNYIIGKPAPNLYHMTIGATGVKVYQNLPNAVIRNASLLLKYSFWEYFAWNGKLSYARGKDNQRENLPLIAPVGYTTSLIFHKEKLFAEADIAGSSRQTHFSSEYGEDETKGYLIANIAFGYHFRVSKTVFGVKSGVENLFDKYYSTYADWKNIPRKGRNFFMNLEIEY